MDVAEFHREYCSQGQRAAKIEYVPVEYQQLLLVLICGYHGVDDDGVGCQSHNANYHKYKLDVSAYQN